jgi:hypothetical protein
VKKLSSYLSAGIAATATFQSSDAATVVTLYGPGARTPSTSPATPVGISMGVATYEYGTRRMLDVSGKTLFAYSFSVNSIFTSGFDLYDTKSTYEKYGLYFLSGGINGAQSGSANFVNISFDGDDGIYEAVGQFYLDGLGTGYLIALAINDDNSALSISAGKAAIDAVPEPSAIALLALGAGGMAMRRRRRRKVA